LTTNTNNNVVQFGLVRDMLLQVDQMRARILTGQVRGLHAILVETGDAEAVTRTGVFEHDPSLALSAVLRASKTWMLALDPPIPPTPVVPLKRRRRRQP
jgi:hypothetical protein